MATATHWLVPPPSLMVMRTGRLRRSVGRMSTHGRTRSPLRAQFVVDERGVHGERALGEVDDAGALVGGDDACAEHGVHGATAEAQQRRQDQFLHRAPSSRVSAGLAGRSATRLALIRRAGSPPRRPEQLRRVDVPVGEVRVEREALAVPRGVRRRRSQIDSYSAVLLGARDRPVADEVVVVDGGLRRPGTPRGRRDRRRWPARRWRPGRRTRRPRTSGASSDDTGVSGPYASIAASPAPPARTGRTRWRARAGPRCSRVSRSRPLRLGQAQDGFVVHESACRSARPRRRREAPG